MLSDHLRIACDVQTSGLPNHQDSHLRSRIQRSPATRTLLQHQRLTHRPCSLATCPCNALSKSRTQSRNSCIRCHVVLASVGLEQFLTLPIFSWPWHSVRVRVGYFIEYLFIWVCLTSPRDLKMLTGSCCALLGTSCPEAHEGDRCRVPLLVMLTCFPCLRW